MKTLHYIVLTLLTALLAHSAQAVLEVKDNEWPFKFNQAQGDFQTKVLNQKPFETASWIPFATKPPTIQFQPLFAYLYTQFLNNEPKDFLSNNKYVANDFKLKNNNNLVIDIAIDTSVILDFLGSDDNKSIYLNLVGLKILEDQKTPEKYLPESMKLWILPNTPEILLDCFDLTKFKMQTLTDTLLENSVLFSEFKTLQTAIEFKKIFEQVNKSQHALDHLARALKNIAT